MADTLTNIQEDVRHYADDGNLTIVSGQGLRIANLIYQGMLSPGFKLLGMVIGRRWPEATRENTSLTMVVGDEDTYTWPATPVFKAPVWLEGIDASTSDPYPIEWAPDMATWSAYDDQNGTDRPTYARLIDVAGTLKLALRRRPYQADTLRITGIIERTEFSSGSSSSCFIHKNADRALAHFIAADYKAKRGDMQRALSLIDDGVSLLPEQDATPSLIGFGRIRPWRF